MNQTPRHTIRLSLRTNALNADHHLWNNNDTFWCHLTLHGLAGRSSACALTPHR